MVGGRIANFSEESKYNNFKAINNYNKRDGADDDVDVVEDDNDDSYYDDDDYYYDENHTLEPEESVTFYIGVKTAPVKSELWKKIFTICFPIVGGFGCLLLFSCYLFRLNGPICWMFSEMPDTDEDVDTETVIDEDTLA